METYNSLLAQFNAVLPPEDTLTQFKALTDELSNNRGKRKMHYLIRKNELKNLSVDEDSDKLNLTCMPATMWNLNTSSVDEFQTISNDNSVLKREILQLQQQIQYIRKHTNEINTELKLFQLKKEQLEVLHKRSQLQMFNATQLLYMAATAINNQEHREQELVSQLKRNKAQVEDEVNALVKKTQLNQNIIKKWNSTKNVHLKTIKEFGFSSFALKSLITTLYTLGDLKKHAGKNLKFEKRQSYEDLDFLKMTNRKCEIIANLNNKGIQFDQRFAIEIIEFYKQLEKQFDRNQRANKQINDHLQILHQNHQIVNKLLEKAYLKKQKQNQMTLKQIQVMLDQSEQILHKNCNLVTSFSTKLYLLLKKLFSLKRFIQKILADAKSRILREVLDNENIEKVLQNYQEYLYRNPQDIQIKWGDSDNAKILFYKSYIYQNDLLRMFSNPNNFCKERADLDNFETFLVSGFRHIAQFTKSMCLYLKSYFKNTKPKTKLYQQKLTEQSCKDFCVQSNEYYRRDDFKLLQKLEKNQLRKKGLLLQIPYNINAENQLITSGEKSQKEKRFSSLCTSRRVKFNKKLIKYTQLATKRQESHLNCSSLRKMLNKLDSFRSRSSSKLHNCRSTLNTTFCGNANQSIQSIVPSKAQKLSCIRFPRNTVGTMQRLNTQKANPYGQ